MVEVLGAFALVAVLLVAKICRNYLRSVVRTIAWEV